ncbi:hypothetical protein FEM48_Zijuj05G0092900 [Ziziphus jujuba var. spinosa]|uniref:DUF4220 domain-containing protein n=1 Tax=Ziziphus jujuba var. spinosa TaxID=714518 RepID=A0A978VE45_ZIZJJ|nr:hypothetical protein FEM48_Zijuj05G0092900 [Ziziphus jujuba var. spinosa]
MVSQRKQGPFLVLGFISFTSSLGAPDSITSFTLEDNEFWLHHLFGLLFQFVGAGYSFYLTFPENKLWFPTILIFVIGTIKCTERTAALYLASLDCFEATALPKPYPGLDYEEAVAIYSTTSTRSDGSHLSCIFPIPKLQGTYCRLHFELQISSIKPGILSKEKFW